MKTNYSNNAVTNKIPIQSMNDTSSLLSPYDQKTTLDGTFERIDLRRTKFISINRATTNH